MYEKVGNIVEMARKSNTAVISFICQDYIMEFFNPVAVIDQGTSGGHDPALHTYDIVLGKQTFDGSAWKSGQSAKGAGVDYKDLEMQGVYAYDEKSGEFTQQIYYPGDETLLAAANAVKGTYTKGKIVEGSIDTSDCWNNQIDRMEQAQYRTSPPVVEPMVCGRQSALPAIGLP